jgi:hypothetical protein
MGSREQAEEIVKTILLDAGCDFMAEDSVKFVAQKIAAKDAEIDRLNLAHAHTTDAIEAEFINLGHDEAKAEAKAKKSKRAKGTR